MTNYEHIYVDLPVLKPWEKLTQPKKREFRNGVDARKRGVPKERNPWKRTINGRDYFVFESYWDWGWERCDTAIAEDRKVDDNLGS